MFWNVRRDPERRDLVRRDARDVLALEDDRAARRVVDPADQVEHRRLARAVGPDDREDLALADVEADIVDGADAAEADREVGHLEQGFAAHRMRSVLR